MDSLQLVSFNVQKKLRRLRRAMGRLSGDLARAVWAFQEAKKCEKGKGLKGMQVFRPLAETSDVAVAVPRSLASTVGRPELVGSGGWRWWWATWWSSTRTGRSSMGCRRSSRFARNPGS